MKTLLLATTVVIALVIGGIYLLIPDKIKIQITGIYKQSAAFAGSSVNGAAFKF